ncbi:hypothetical protein [Streptomyces sp. CC210A]|uniref:hypothetical protein n=1 Tax=Streptomyces sp. CC210A TaxID=2898184 RepID=UPI001F231F24|nr:hypothetical protein [Streptomyces sp. CC210A]
MNKHVLTASLAAVALVAAPTAAVAAAPTVTATHTAAPAGADATAAAPAGADAAAPAGKRLHDRRVRVVLPGERVGVAPGWEMWLTQEGKHWSGPDGYENFRSVVDGNIDPTQPGVSLQTDGSDTGILHTGLYYGTRHVGRVELTYGGSTTVRAALVELPGRPGWGAWHLTTPVYDQSGTPGVALYDRAGKLLAELPARDF